MSGRAALCPLCQALVNRTFDESGRGQIIRGTSLTRSIDSTYLDSSTPSRAYRLETYRSTGAISSTISQQLRCYFISRCVFPSTPPKKNAQGQTDIRSVSDSGFLERATSNTLEIYQEVMNEVERRSGPVIEMFEVEDSRERRIVIGYK